MSTQPPERPKIPDYELLRPIGCGSYGEVWLARSVTGVFRVIKLVRRDRFENDRPYRRELEGISRFQATATGRPRQLALLHVGRNDAEGYFYYVMEPADDAESGSAIDPDRYVPLTLREMFRRRGRLPASECVHLALELARGLAILHGAGLIHRDIKPSNIIFVQQVPKLADVGLVVASESTMTCAGTPGYAPDEGAGTVAADIYSLGKVLYEIATGLDRTEFPRLPPEVADGPDAPLLREINTLVLRACDPNPRERHASADQLARDLELIQAGRSVAFYETLRKRLRATALVAAAIAILTASGAALFLWRSRVLQNANDHSRDSLYRSDLAVAQLALSVGDLGRARAALARQIPRPGETELRGLEWDILNYSVRGEGRPLESAGKGVAVREIAVDPTGRYVAAGFADDTAALWNFASGQLIRHVTNVAVLGGFTQDGLLVVDELERALRYERPEGKVVRRANTGQRLLTFLPSGRALVVSPSGSLRLQIVDAVGAPTGAEYIVDLENPNSAVSVATATLDEKSLVISLFEQAGASRERWLKAIDLPECTLRWSRLLTHRTLWTVASPNGQLVASGIGGLTATILELSDPKSEINLAGHTARIEAGAFSFDSRFIATASSDQTVRIWESSTGRAVSLLHGLGQPVKALSWHPEGSALVAGDDKGSLRVFSTIAKEARDSISGLFADMQGDFTFSRDGGLIAASSTKSEVLLLETTNMTVLGRIEGGFQPVMFSDDDSKLIFLDSNWNLHASGLHSDKITAPLAFLPANYFVNSFANSSDRRKIAFSDLKGGIVVLDVTNKEHWHVQDPKSNTVWGMTFSADSRLFWSGAEDGTILRRESATGTLVRMETKLDGEVESLAISPDGKWLAAAIYEDATIRIVDLTTSRVLPPLHSHRRFAQTMFFSPKADRLISGGSDGRIVVWRVPEFEEITSFGVDPPTQTTGDEGIAVLQYSPESRILAALTEDGRIKIWRSAPTTTHRP